MLVTGVALNRVLKNAIDRSALRGSILQDRRTATISFRVDLTTGQFGRLDAVGVEFQHPANTGCRRSAATGRRAPRRRRSSLVLSSIVRSTRNGQSGME